MKYYRPEHEEGYRKIKEQGKTSWGELHGEPGWENLGLRSFLEEALPKLSFSTPTPRALEYGCGTGFGACFLASQGFQVDAMDLSPVAIEMARQFATERNLDISFCVQDICNMPQAGTTYDLILDSHCLQCIVTDADRSKLFSAVHARLHPMGYYLVITAIFREDRKYGEDIFDEQTGIAYSKRYLQADPEQYEEAVKIKGEWYIPNRRHLKPDALKMELEGFGFKVLWQDGGKVVCVRN